MTRFQNALLGIVTACALVATAAQIWPLFVSDARADEGAVVCETWAFALDPGRKAGVANVDAHRIEMQERIRRLTSPTSRVVYSDAFPIMSMGFIDGWSGIYCVAR